MLKLETNLMKNLALPRGILEDEYLSTLGRRNEYNVCQSDVELIELFRFQSF